MISHLFQCFRSFFKKSFCKILACGLILPLLGVLILEVLSQDRFLSPAPPTSENEKPKVVAQMNVLPLYFEPNKGQTDPKVKFLTRGAGYTLFFSSQELTMVLMDPKRIDPSTEQKSNPLSSMVPDSR